MSVDFRPPSGQIPTDPGVYRFRDPDGRVIYVGKAKNLRARLTSYFQDPAALHPRTQSMLASARSVDWTVVTTEVEALNLEYALIKEFDPRFNVRYRDDKSYPFLAVTVGEEIPRALVMRGEKRPGVRYFGPYAHAWAIRETVDQLLRVFPMRTCSQGVFRRARASGRPCLLGYIDKCSAPCVGAISPEAHQAIVADFCAFMAGDSAGFVRDRREQMAAAAQAQEYERAARLRDDVFALERVLERNAVVLPDGTDVDVVGLAGDELEASVRVFHVRDGRVRGERGFIVERVDDADDGRLVAALLTQMYGGVQADVPRRILVPATPPEAERLVLEEWLRQRRGGPVRVSVPRRGDPRALLQTVTRNAEQSLATHKLRRSGDLTTRSQALTEIAEALDLPTAPLRIECFDVSNLGPDDVVASMVVFEDGLPKPSEYRKFAIRGFTGQNDVAAIAEVLGRRFRRMAAQGDPADGPAGTPRGRFAYPPSLVVIDGGPPQVAAAFGEIQALGIPDVAVCGLAKRLEEVWLPDDADPIVLPRTSQGLYLLQRIRDEAHRTAVRYQRQKRSTRMTTSALDTVPGLGPVRRKALLKRFGSVRRIRQATPAELAEVPGIGPSLAANVLAALAGSTGRSVNLTTGEIVGDDGPVREVGADDAPVPGAVGDDGPVDEEAQG